MTAMTPMLKVVRRAKAIYVLDWAENETLVATAPTNEQASWVANSLAGWHNVSLEETDDPKDAPKESANRGGVPVTDGTTRETE